VGQRRWRWIGSGLRNLRLLILSGLLGVAMIGECDRYPLAVSRPTVDDPCPGLRWHRGVIDGREGGDSGLLAKIDLLDELKRRQIEFIVTQEQQGGMGLSKLVKGEVQVVSGGRLPGFVSMLDLDQLISQSRTEDGVRYWINRVTYRLNPIRFWLTLVSARGGRFSAANVPGERYLLNPAFTTTDEHYFAEWRATQLVGLTSIYLAVEAGVEGEPFGAVVERLVRGGRFFSAFDGLAPAGDFRTCVVDRSGRGAYQMGEQIDRPGRYELVVRRPMLDPQLAVSFIRVYRDGTLIGESQEARAAWPIEQPGRYTVDVWVSQRHVSRFSGPRELLPWILTNPITIGSNPKH